MNNHGSMQVTLSTGSIIKVVVILTIGFLLYLLLDLILVLLTSVVIASAVEPATRWFAQYKVPRIPAVLIVYIMSFVAVLGFLYIFIPPLFDDVSRLAIDLPNKIQGDEVTSGLFGPISGISKFTPAITLETMLTQLRSTVESLSGGIFNTASTLFGGAFSFMLMLVLSFYLAVQERGIDNFLRLVAPVRHEKYIIDLWRRSQAKIGQWMKGQLLLGLLVGVMVFLGLTILGVRFAFVLAVLAAIMELIPVFGPIISAVPAILIGFTISPTTGLMTTGLYLLIQQFENHLLYPLVVKKIVGVSPIIVIIALIVGGQLFGFLGLILAVPVATVLMEIVEDMEKRRALASTLA